MIILLAMRFDAISGMFSMIPSVIRGVSIDDLQTIKKVIRASFPSVPQLGIPTFADWLDEPGSLLLVDVRAPDEYAVSHLRGAINLDATEDIQRAIAERRPSRIVLYCSVGFRSSRIAAQLIDENPAIHNLEGSIFEWANQGRPLFQGKEPAASVHPFGARWAGLLKEGLASNTATTRAPNFK